MRKKVKFGSSRTPTGSKPSEGQGWHHEPTRHSLASRGIKSGQQHRPVKIRGNPEKMRRALSRDIKGDNVESFEIKDDKTIEEKSIKEEKEPEKSVEEEPEPVEKPEPEQPKKPDESGEGNV